MRGKMDAEGNRKERDMKAIIKTAGMLDKRDAELLRRYARGVVRIARARGLTEREREQLPPLPETLGEVWQIAGRRERVLIHKMARTLAARRDHGSQ